MVVIAAMTKEVAAVESPPIMRSAVIIFKASANVVPSAKNALEERTAEA